MSWRTEALPVADDEGAPALKSDRADPATVDPRHGWRDKKLRNSNGLGRNGTPVTRPE